MKHESYKQFKRRTKNKKKLERIKKAAEENWKINQEYKKLLENI